MKTDFINFSKQEPTTDNIKECLPLFIDVLKGYHKSTVDYRTHVNKAINEHYFIIRYEDLLENTASTMREVISYFNKGKEVDDVKLKEAIDFCSFESAKKRQKKDTGFFRQGGGKSGDWKNHFNFESAKLYNNYAGDLLVKFNYEKDLNWINEFK